MRRTQFMLLDATIAAAIFLPLFYWLNKRYFHSKRRTIWYFMLAVYLSGVYAVVGLPDIRYARFDLHFNFIPFAYMFSDYRSSLLNVLLFIPLGFFLPVFGQRYKNLGWTLLFGLGLSMVIETMQIFTLRATDINDLITNTAGALVGWCFGRLFVRLCPDYPLEERSQPVRMVFLICFLVMFFLHPFFTDAVFFLLAL